MLLYKITIIGLDSTYFGNFILYHIYSHTSFFSEAHRIDSMLIHDWGYVQNTVWLYPFPFQ